MCKKVVCINQNMVILKRSKVSMFSSSIIFSKCKPNRNNKLYVLHGKNIILLTEDGGNGSVHGMIFLGKFEGEQSVGKIETGI